MVSIVFFSRDVVFWIQVLNMDWQNQQDFLGLETPETMLIKYSSQHLKWIKTFPQCYTWILNNTRSCLKTTLMNFFWSLQMLHYCTRFCLLVHQLEQHKVAILIKIRDYLFVYLIFTFFCNWLTLDSSCWSHLLLHSLPDLCVSIADPSVVFPVV